MSILIYINMFVHREREENRRWEKVQTDNQVFCTLLHILFSSYFSFYWVLVSICITYLFPSFFHSHFHTHISHICTVTMPSNPSLVYISLQKTFEVIKVYSHFYWLVIFCTTNIHTRPVRGRGGGRKIMEILVEKKTFF